MSEHDDLTFYRQIKARTEHNCAKCAQLIKAGDLYYAEDIKDRFLHSLHRKKFCRQCYQAMEQKKGELNNAFGP